MGPRRRLSFERGHLTIEPFEVCSVKCVVHSVFTPKLDYLRGAALASLIKTKNFLGV